MTAILAPMVPVFESLDGEAHHGDVLVAIPAYNEERFIGSVVHGVLLEGFRCLVIDDGSSDRTVEIASAAGALVMRHDRNYGKGTALNLAFELARHDGVNVLVAMDGDWQHDPREINDLIVPIRLREAQIVSGSRFLTSERRRIPAVRGFGLRAVTVMSNAVSGDWLTDSQTGFHAFSREAIDALHFRSDGFSVESEVQFLARIEGLKHIEVPIRVRYDDPPKRNVFRQGAQVVDGLIRLVAHYRPLLFFGVPSFVMLLTGVIMGGIVVDGYQRNGELAVGYGLLTVLLLVLGSIGLLAGVLLHVMRGVFLGLEHQIHSLSQSIGSDFLDRR